MDIKAIIEDGSCIRFTADKKLEFNKNYELKREIDDQDKFYIVKVKVGEWLRCQVGWIEKEFTERSEYEQYKANSIG